jgi:hypothetical protein
MIDSLVFLCGARDFHAMDWYKSAKGLLIDKNIYILTDLIAGEGYKKIIDENDKSLFKLIIIDRFLFKKQSHYGNVWRNIVKLLVFPIQVALIKKFAKKHPDAIYHAHSMYYLFLAMASKIPYVGTPQGSDILVKPFKSKLYRYFTIKSLKNAKAITVDSAKMQEKIYELSGLNAYIIQNGIDIEAITKSFNEDCFNRDKILSIRGFTPLYRINEIIVARNNSKNYSGESISLIYPFFESEYKQKTIVNLKSQDVDLGRLDRSQMYEILKSTKIVISIPISDSSPRSVYEAIFCGCAVVITYHPYYDNLPECMKERIVIININDNEWFDNALSKVEKILQTEFIASEEVLDTFDQKKSFLKLKKILFT